MSSNPGPKVDPNLLEQKRRQINRLVEEIARLSDSQLPPLEYYAEFLQRVLTALAAPAGAVWARSPQGHLQLQYQINFREVGFEQIPGARECHDELLRQTVQQSRPRLVPPQSGIELSNDGPVPANLTRFFILLAPVVLEKQVVALLEVWQDADRSPNAQRGFLSFLQDMTVHVGDYIRNTKLRQVLGEQQVWTQLEAYARQVHNSLKPRQVAYLVANEARRLIACDRVSVASRLGSSTKVEAISGADVIEKRSSLVQTMRTLFDQVLVWGERLVYAGSKDDSLPPKVLDALDAYLAESNSKVLIVQPMKDEREADSNRPCRSAMMVECFEPDAPAEEFISRMDVVIKHAAPAMYNALEYHRLPLRWLLQPLAKVKDGLRGKPLAIAGAIAGGVVFLTLFLTLVPWELRMDAKGNLLPKQRRVIYSRVKGTVDVMVNNLDPVNKGQELARIRDLEMESQLNRLLATMDAARERIQLLEESLSRPGLTPELRANYKAQIIQNQVELGKAKAEYDKRVAYAGHARYAIVTAPFRGTVVTFDPIEKLQGRFVNPGDPLLQVARLDGAWEIVLKIPEASIGHVRESLAKSPTGYLDVDLMLVSHPNRTYRGRLYRGALAGQAEADEEETVVRARIEIEDIPREELTGLLVDTEVRAKVRCGKRAVGYVLFYELWEFFYEKVLFKLDL